MEIPKGYCQCGCGGKTLVAKKTRTADGHIKGQPKRFINGHNMRGKTGKNSPNWKGGRTHDGNGYIKINQPSHPRASSKGQIPEHILVAERIFGKPLPLGAVIHHKDGNPANNNPSNLVICQDNSYHMLLHTRAKALKEYGNASWRKCGFCHRYDDPVNLKINVGKGGCTHHLKCKRDYERNRVKRINGGKLYEPL